MADFKCTGILLLILIPGLFQQAMISGYEDLECNKKPFQTKTEPLSPDDRFVLEVVGVDQDYIPSKTYKIRLYTKDQNTKFTAFTISATGDEMENEKNPRKKIPLYPGRILGSLDANVTDTRTSELCPETVFEANVTPKTYVEATWIAPPKGNRCVKVYAYVAIKADVWYSSNGPLSRTMCEDHRNEQDMKPPENSKCNVCGDARYELTFQGMWSYNTHPLTFPTSDGHDPKFSDIVGASHNKDFILFKDNKLASRGLQKLAEQGNTSLFEEEILSQLPVNVRTVIKATGPSKPSLSAVSSFRTSPQHHFISMVAAIIPSPDWFLGVYNMELCNLNDTWREHAILNLYPLDAGTDSGRDFNSPNEMTSPPQVIDKATIGDQQYDKMRPFATLKVDLIKTYSNPNCEQQLRSATEDQRPTEDESGAFPEQREPEPDVPSGPRTSRPPAYAGVDNVACPPTTAWDPWPPCEGECIDNRVAGWQTRFRSFIVKGEEYDYDNGDDSLKGVPEVCVEKYHLSETRRCEDECTPPDPVVENPEARRSGWKDWIKPGQHWGSW